MRPSMAERLNPEFTALAQSVEGKNLPSPLGGEGQGEGERSMRQNLIQTARARQLRREQTPGEKALWKMLRARRLGGLKVRRQVPLGPWIADFYCADLKLVIETETGPRDQPDVDADADVDRDSWMRGEGITVLRLRTRDILNDPAGCAALIHQMARELTG